MVLHEITVNKFFINCIQSGYANVKYDFIHWQNAKTSPISHKVFFFSITWCVPNSSTLILNDVNVPIKLHVSGGYCRLNTESQMINDYYMSTGSWIRMIVVAWRIVRKSWEKKKRGGWGRKKKLEFHWRKAA